jgi:endonuclease/exonuclease/phosphatase family metal-dependent hydrolase
MAKETSPRRILDEWSASPRIHDADVLLLQEVREEVGTQCIAQRLGAALGLHVAYSPEAGGVNDRGLAILSRFPLRDVATRPLRRFDLTFHSRARFALAATADTPWGPVRLENVHLDTRLNSADRLAQLEPAIRDSARFQTPRIVAGDFNSNPFFWIGHVLPLPSLESQAKSVDSYMRGLGFRSAIPESATTFDYLGMHLDWIWMTGLRSTGYEVLPLKFSDHHAVWTRVVLSRHPPV